MRIEALLTDHNPWWRAPDARHVGLVPQRRTVVDVLVQHLLGAEAPTALVLVGARQVGKTTAVKHAIDRVLDTLRDPGQVGRVVYFDFADERLRGGAGLREVLEACPPSVGARFLLFDEIQKLERWDETLRFLVDHASPTALLRPGDRVILTGSQASDLRRGSRESGPGRWTEHALEPLDFCEFARLSTSSGEAAERLLASRPHLVAMYRTRGGFPGWMFIEQEARARRLLREAISNKTVAQDLTEAGIDAVAAGRLLAYLCENSGAKFVAAKHAAALGAGVGAGYDARSVAAWRQELEHTGLVLALPRYTANAASRVRSKDKLYAVDHGLVSAYSPLPEPGQDFATRARIQETLVYRHLRAFAASSRGGLAPGAISYVDHKGREVDFAVQHGSALALVEVTTSESEGELRKKVAQLRRVGSALGTSHRCVVHGGVEDRFENGVRLLPLHRFMLDPSRVLEVS